MSSSSAVVADVESPAVPALARHVSEDSIASQNGATLEDKLAALVATHADGVLIFTKPGCPFCAEVQRSFASLGVPYALCELSKSDVKKALAALSHHTTFPNVYIKARRRVLTPPVPPRRLARCARLRRFILHHTYDGSPASKGKHVGGCDTVKSLEATGELYPQVRDLVVITDVRGGSLLTLARVAPPRGEAMHPLLWFPDVTNRWVNQLTGIFVVSLCILGIIYRQHRWGWWLTAFILLDFGSRFMAGAQVSLLAQIASLLLAPFESWTFLRPQFKAGPPKQFAAFCGIVFSVISTSLYFAAYHTSNTTYYTAGAVVLAGLAGAAALEGFFDFCLGCEFFSIGVSLGLLPNYVYRIATNQLAEAKASWEYLHLPSGAPTPVRAHGEATGPTGLAYKIKTPEWTKDDFNPIRNMQVTYFSMPMGLAGLAVAFKIASPWARGWAETTLGSAAAGLPGPLITAPHQWWWTFAIISAIVYGAMLVLYALRVALHPRKVAKEWADPARSNAFALVAALPFLFAFLVYDIHGPHVQEGRQLRFARVLWWIGAVSTMMLTVSKLSEWVCRSLTVEHVNPAWMLVPSTNLLAALVAPVLPLWSENAGYSNTVFGLGPRTSCIELAGFFFAIGIFMWVVLFTITFFCVATTHNTVEGVRGSAYVWITPPTIGGLAYLVIDIARSNDPAMVVATFAQSYYLSIVLFLALAWSWAPFHKHFGQNKFDMSYWNITFSLDALAASAAMYHTLSGFAVARVLMVGFLTVAALANGLCFLHTLTAIVKRRVVFTPDEKFGPLSLMRLTHEAIRGSLPALVAALHAMDAGDEASIRDFASLYARLTTVHEEHSRHEDTVVFKTFEEFFPTHAATWLGDHEADRERLAHFNEQIDSLLSNPGGVTKAAVSDLQAGVSAFITHLEEHLRGEEDHILPSRKVMNIELQKQLVRRLWAATDAAKWETVLPFVILHLPRHVQRVKYIQAFTWAMPERAQQIGAILYRTVDAVMWERLRVYVPAVVPRGVPHHVKFF